LGPLGICHPSCCRQHPDIAPAIDHIDHDMAAGSADGDVG
jgi:hypothetical protein